MSDVETADRDQLHSDEHRLRALVERATEMLAIFAADGTTLYESPSNRTHVGWAPEELVGRNMLDHVHPDDVERVREAFAHALAHPGTSVHAEYRYRHRDGGWRVLSSVGTSLVDDPAVAGVVVSSRDVTEQRALEAQLHQARKMEAIGRLAGGIAHDFSNVLAAIVLHAETLLLQEGHNERVRAGLSHILQVAGRGTRFAEQLLALGRREPRAPQRVDLNALVRDMEAMLRRLVPAEVRIETRYDPALPAVHADPAQLERVLLNLAVNARDAMPHGGTLRISTERGTLPGAAPAVALPPGPVTVLTVSDTGTGMSPVVRERVFEPFFTTKEEGRGTGLGMAIVYGAVTQAGGAVAVESEEGRGTTVRVVLPAAAEG